MIDESKMRCRHFKLAPHNVLTALRKHFSFFAYSIFEIFLIGKDRNASRQLWTSPACYRIAGW